MKCCCFFTVLSLLKQKEFKLLSQKIRGERRGVTCAEDLQPDLNQDTERGPEGGWTGQTHPPRRQLFMSHVKLLCPV